MRVGVALSPSWLADLTAVHDAVVRFDAAGLDHVCVGGHLLTARIGRYPDRPPSRYAETYRDPFVLFSSLAPVTSRIRFRTSILILPMLPAALVAKQAADLAILSGGRLDLGVGVSWQDAEYRALGRSLKGRARMMEEQVEVLRMLWSQPFPSFQGTFHTLDGIGVGALPPPIPIWFGTGTGEVPLRRVARLADGWLPLTGPTADSVERLRSYAREAGREANVIQIAARITADDDVIDAARTCIAAGVTELTIGAPPELEIAEGTGVIIQAAKTLSKAAVESR